MMNVVYAYDSKMDIELSRKVLLCDNEEYLRDLPVNLSALGERVVIN